MAAYAVWHRKTLRKEGNLAHVMGALAVLGVAILGLLSLNLAQTGHLSGGGRPPAGGLDIVHVQAAHLGWGFIRSVSGQLPVARMLGGIESAGGLMVGWMLLATLLGLFSRPMVARGLSKLKPVSMVVVGYLLSMIVFRSISEFVDLSGSRFILPILPLSLVLIVKQIKGWGRNVIGAMAIAILAMGVFAVSVVGMRRTDISTGKQVLDNRVAAADTVLVNGPARRIATYYEAHFLWDRSSTTSELLSSVRSCEACYGVFLANWTEGYGGERRDPLREPYRQFCEKAGTLEGIKEIVVNERGCVIRKTE